MGTAAFACISMTSWSSISISYDRRWEDNPAHDSYYPEPGTRRVTYRSGVFVGYRGYERNKTEALFPFGYGLSYTTFSYGNLAITPVTGALSKSGPRFEVTFDVTNTGKRARRRFRASLRLASRWPDLAPSEGTERYFKGDPRSGRQAGAFRYRSKDKRSLTMTQQQNSGKRTQAITRCSSADRRNRLSCSRT
jgi:beta-glucosidase